MYKEEKDELPVSPKPDVGPAPVVGQDHGSSSPQGEQTSAALLNEGEADSPIMSSNKVCLLGRKIFISREATSPKPANLKLKDDDFSLHRD